MRMDATTLLMLAGAAVLVYYLSTQSSAVATPLSIYPSMAKSSTQKASTATVLPSSLYTATQGQAQSAIAAQCVGAYPGCTPLMADTQLGF